MKALLILIDGTTYQGISVGAIGTATGEVVFNTSMTGYQEILTDPSYAGQLVSLTYPLIGNYGVNNEDGESVGPQVAGFIVKEMCEDAIQLSLDWRWRRLSKNQQNRGDSGH